MDNSISRQAAIDAMKKQREELLKGLDKNSDVYGIISASTGIMICTVGQLPSAQPEQKRAKWIATTSLQKGQITWIDYKCSNCSHHRKKPMNFCEICGAKMERGEAIK